MHDVSALQQGAHSAAQVANAQDGLDLARLQQLFELLRKVWTPMWDVKVADAKDQHGCWFVLGARVLMRCLRFAEALPPRFPNFPGP